jgi:hypothetical protein
MKKSSGKKGEKDAKAMQTTQRSMESRSPRGFSRHMSPYDMTPRNLHEDSTNPPIWISGSLDSIKQIKNKVDKNMAEERKSRTKPLKNEDEDKRMVKDHEKDSLMGADHKKEEESR